MKSNLIMETNKQINWTSWDGIALGLAPSMWLWFSAFVCFHEQTAETSSSSPKLAGFQAASAVGHLRHGEDRKTPQLGSGGSACVYRTLIFRLFCCWLACLVIKARLPPLRVSINTSQQSFIWNRNWQKYPSGWDGTKLVFIFVFSTFEMI